MTIERGGPQHCAVWGSPIGHSLSPALHRAAYAALGLTDWQYTRREVTAGEFAAALSKLSFRDEPWLGLSLTMPLKELALTASVWASDTALATGSANTLVRHDDGWHAHNTDVYGIRAALAAAGPGAPPPRTALVVGAGATARSALSALAAAGVGSITFLVRDTVRPETMAQARAAGLDVDLAPWGSWPQRDVVVSTVPPERVLGLDRFPPPPSGGGVVLDVVYGSGQTPLEAAALGRGWQLARGVEMLLHQAGEQVRLMTGHPAPLDAMAAALPTLANVAPPPGPTPALPSPE